MTAYYVHNNGLPANQTRGLASQVRTELDAIAASFVLMPSAPSLAAGLGNYAVDTGAADAYVITASTQVTAYADGQTFLVKAAHTNTTASTINVSSLGLKSINRADNSALQAGDIVAGQIIQITYSTTSGAFQLNATGAAVSATAAAASAAAALTSQNAAATSATNAATSETNAGTSATNAALSATAAANYAAALTATSTTSLLIAVASKTFTTQSGKQFAAGQFASAVSAANNANYMHGQVTSYSGTTLVLNVTNIGGSGTLADWNLSVSGSRGATGAKGDAGASGALTKAEVAGTTQTASAGNDYWLINVAATAVTPNASPVDAERFKVTPTNGRPDNTILFGSATVVGYAISTTGTITMNPPFPMSFQWSSTLSKWVQE